MKETSIKISWIINKGTTLIESNSYSDNKVQSKESCYHNNKVFIKDLKSSNGKFINGIILSARSDSVKLRHGDYLEFGVDIINEQDKSILFHKVATKVYLSYPVKNFDVEINEIERQKQLQMIMNVLSIL